MKELESVNYVSTFNGLKMRYEQQQDGLKDKVFDRYLYYIVCLFNHNVSFLLTKRQLCKNLHNQAGFKVSLFESIQDMSIQNETQLVLIIDVTGRCLKMEIRTKQNFVKIFLLSVSVSYHMNKIIQCLPLIILMIE